MEDAAIDRCEPLKVAVLLPTTGEILTIAKVSPLPNVPRSNATLFGDFRPLPGIATSYHGLVNGPLASHLGLTGQWLLEISGPIEKGRSWELPALVAHLIVQSGAALTSDIQEADHIVWSTGAIDSALAPIKDDYSLAPKAVLSEEFLADARSLGKPISVLTADLNPSDRDIMGSLASVKASAEASSLDGVRRFLQNEIGGTETSETEVSAVATFVQSPPSASTPTSQPSGLSEVSARTSTSKRKAGIIIFASIAALGGIFAFGASNGLMDIINGSTRTLAPMIAISQNYAPNRKACIAKIVSGQNFESKSAPLRDGEITLSGKLHTCALAFMNNGEKAISIRLDNALSDHVMPGDNPIRRAITLRAGEQYQLPFRSAPFGVSTQATLSTEDTKEILNLTFKNEGIE